MKRKILAVLLLLPLILVGCKKNKTTELPVKNETKTSQNQKTNEKTSQNQKNGTDKEENTSLTEEDPLNEDKEGSTLEPTQKSYNRDFLKNLCDDSSYISRVRINQESGQGYAANFVVDYKGDLSQVELDIPKNLTSGREYIIFYKDDDNGKIVPTRSEDSFIEIVSSDDKALSYVENRYKRQEKTESTNSSTIEKDNVDNSNEGRN